MKKLGEILLVTLLTLATVSFIKDGYDWLVSKIKNKQYGDLLLLLIISIIVIYFLKM